MMVAFLVLVLCLVVPGAMIGAGARRPLADVLLLAPVLSLACVGIGCTAAGVLHLPWSWWIPGAVGLLLGLLARLLTQRTPRRRGPSSREWPTVVALCAGVLSGAGLVLVILHGNMESFSQGFDNVFHLNAIRYAEETRNASPLHIGDIIRGDGTAEFYPSTWHALASVVGLTGISVPAATNVVTLGTAALCWPASLLYLVRGLTRKPVALLVAGLLSGAFGAFPALLLYWGILYPNFLGYAALPAVLGLLVRCTEMDRHLAGEENMVPVRDVAPQGLGSPSAASSRVAAAGSVSSGATSPSSGSRSASSLSAGSPRVATSGARAERSARTDASGPLARSAGSLRTGAEGSSTVAEPTEERPVLPWALGARAASSYPVQPVAQRTLPQRLVLLGLFLLAALGMAMAHPNAVLGLMALGLPLVLWRILELLIVVPNPWQRRLPARRRIPASGRRGLLGELSLLALALVSVPVVWTVLRPAQQPPQEYDLVSIKWVLIHTFAASPIGVTPVGHEYPMDWPVLLLVVLAMAVLLLSRALWRHTWLLLSFAVLLVLNLAVMRLPWEIRNLLTGPWYNDRFRIFALLPTVLVPVLALATARTTELLQGLLSRGPRRARRALSGALAVLMVLLAVVPVATSGTTAQAISNARSRFQAGPEAELVSQDELEVIRHIPDHVGADQTILENPYTGGGVAYALTGRRVSDYHIIGKRPRDMAYLTQHLAQARTDPRVCQLVHQHRVGYVLDFGDRAILGSDRLTQWDGLKGLEASGVAQTVYQQGQAKLLRITACGTGA